MAVKNKNNLVAKSVAQLTNDKNLNTSETGFDFYGRNFKINNEKAQVESAMRYDTRMMFQKFERLFYSKWVESIEDYTLSTGRRFFKLKKDQREGFSNVKQPIIRTFVDRLLKGIIKANFTVKASSVNKENKDKVKAVQTAIEWCFATSKAKRKILQVASSALLNGNGFVKASFDTPEERLNNIKNPDSKEVVRINKEYAKFDWVSEFDLLFEPTEPIRGAQRAVIRRSIKPLKNVLEMVYKMDSYISPEHLKYIMSSPKPFSNKDYNIARLVKYYDNFFECENPVSYDSVYETAINNDKVEYVEIWTPDTLSICINGYVVADTENPLKSREKWHPYFSAHYTESAGTGIHEGLGILLGDVQKGYDALFNLLFDQAAMSASPMIMLGPGQQLVNDESDTVFKRKAWGIMMNAGPGSVSFLTPPSVDQGVVSILQNMLEMAQFNVAPASYADYNTQSRSAQDSMLRFEGLADTVALFVESMSNMLNDVAQAWLLDMQSKMPEIFELPIFDNKGIIKEWKKINRSDLEGKYIFEWQSESIRDVNTIIEKENLPAFIAALGNFGVSDEGRSLVDKKKILEYITSLYNIDSDVILDNDTYDSVKKDIAIKNASIEQEVALIQADTQEHIMERQQKYQESQQGSGELTQDQILAAFGG